MPQATARDVRMCHGTFFILKMKTYKKPKASKQLPLPSALCKNKESPSLLSAFQAFHRLICGQTAKSSDASPEGVHQRSVPLFSCIHPHRLLPQPGGAILSRCGQMGEDSVLIPGRAGRQCPSPTSWKRRLPVSGLLLLRRR